MTIETYGKVLVARSNIHLIEFFVQLLVVRVVFRAMRCPFFPTKIAVRVQYLRKRREMRQLFYASPRFSVGVARQSVNVNLDAEFFHRVLDERPQRLRVEKLRFVDKNDVWLEGFRRPT